jgi:HSP20 family protein
MTSSIKWEPLEDLKAVGDLVSRVLIRPWVNVSIPGLRSMQRGWVHPMLGVRQPVDMYETDEAFVAELDVPGMEAEDLNVVVSGAKVTVTGERCLPGDCAEVKGPAYVRPTYVRRERPRGRFSRKLTIPDGVEVDQIKARLQNGVLVLSMPKKANPEVVKVVPKATRHAPGEAPASAPVDEAPAGEA